MRIFFIISITVTLITNTTVYAAGKKFAPVETSSAYRGMGRPVSIPVLKPTSPKPSTSPSIPKIKLDDTHSVSSGDSGSDDLFGSDSSEDGMVSLPEVTPSPIPSPVLCDASCYVPTPSPSLPFTSPLMSRKILSSTGSGLPSSASDTDSLTPSSFSFPSEKMQIMSGYTADMESDTDIPEVYYTQLNETDTYSIGGDGESRSSRSLMLEDDKPATPTTVNQQITDSYDHTNLGLIAASKMSYIPNLEIAHRLDSISMQNVTDRQLSYLGVSAGDDHRYRVNNVWITGVYNSSSQTNYKKSASYKAAAHGGIIGGDVNITDNILLGGAYSYIASEFNYEMGKDRLSSTHNLFSLYGQYELTNNIFMQAIASYSQGRVRTFITAINGKGSFRNQGYSFENYLFYKINLPRVIIIPQIGLKYNRYTDAEYVIINSGNSISVASHTASIYSVMGGIKFMVSPFNMGDNMYLLPIFTLGIERDIKNHSEPLQFVVVYKNNSFINTTTVKPPVTSYSMGLNLIMQYRNWEVTPSYHYQFREKYQNHQIAVKLKFLF